MNASQQIVVRESCRLMNRSERMILRHVTATEEVQMVIVLNVVAHLLRVCVRLRIIALPRLKIYSVVFEIVPLVFNAGLERVVRL